MKSLIKRQKLFSYGDRRRDALGLNLFKYIASKTSPQKPITIGVDIGLDCLRFIKTTRTSDKTPILLDYKCVPFPPDISKQTPGFEAFLQSELTLFYGQKKKYGLWAIMPTAHIDVSHIRIPKSSKIPVENAVYWAVKKESSFDEEESILDFEVAGEVVEQNTTKLLIMVYTAPIKEVEQIRMLFYRIGMPLAGISITPFGIENIFRSGWVSKPDRTNAVLFIGNDFSRIDIYFHGNLVLTRDIKTGTKSKIESLIEAFNYKKHALTRIKEDTEKMNDEQARKILFSLSHDSPPLTEEDVGFGLKEEEIFEMILPALKRLVRQLERTFEYYESAPGAEKVDKIYVSGVLNVNKLVIEYISNELGMEGGVLDPLNTQALCKDLTSVSERVAFTPSIGIALSDNTHTPNLLFTYKDRKKENKLNRVNLGIFAVFMIVVFICFSIFILQRHSSAKKQTIISGLKRQLSEYKTLLSKDLILQMSVDVKKQQEGLKAYSKRHLGLAVINEITVMTPPHIRITNLKALLGDVLSNGKNAAQKTNASVLGVDGIIIIDGIIMGDRQTIEASLLDYVMKLRTSKMFSQTHIQESGFVSTEMGIVLNFTIKIQLA